MFGFVGLGRLSRTQQADEPQVAPRESDSVRGKYLVSKEDIFRHSEDSRQEPVLLLRKGSCIQAEELPKFIRNGADPAQFRLHRDGEARLRVDMPLDAQDTARTVDGMTNPIRDAEHVRRMMYARKRVMLLEPEPKQMKRLIDCFFKCGFNLGRIHPVRLSAHLEWAVSRHQPHIVVADYRLPNGQSGLNLLWGLVNSQPGIEQLILVVPPLAQMHELEAKLLGRLCAEKKIKMLSRPVNRFDLQDLLSQDGP